MKPEDKHYADARKFYKRLLGREIKGNLKLTLIKGDPNELQQEFTLNIEDEAGSQRIVFKVSDENFGPEYHVFKTSQDVNSGGYVPAAASAFLGAIEFNNQKIPLLIREELGLRIDDISDPLNPTRIFKGFFR